MKKKKSLVALLGVAVIGVVGGTFAFFQSQGTFPNIFHAALYQTKATETFTSPDNWLPGDTTPKVLNVENTGDVDAVVRVKYVESWVDANGDDLDATQNGVRAAIISPNHRAQNANTNWIYNTDDGYYYYKYRLSPNGTTTNFIESVTFNPEINIDVDSNCTGDDIGEGTTVCTYTSDSYGGGTYTLTITVETAQYQTNDGTKVYTQVDGWEDAPDNIQ